MCERAKVVCSTSPSAWCVWALFDCFLCWRGRYCCVFAVLGGVRSVRGAIPWCGAAHPGADRRDQETDPKIRAPPDTLPVSIRYVHSTICIPALPPSGVLFTRAQWSAVYCVGCFCSKLAHVCVALSTQLYRYLFLCVQTLAQWVRLDRSLDAAPAFEMVSVCLPACPSFTHCLFDIPPLSSGKGTRCDIHAVIEQRAEFRQFARPLSLLTSKYCIVSSRLV